MGKLYLATALQVALFECEIKGQLSDGRWENALPYDHWKPWCEAEAVARRDAQGRTFWVRRDTYGLTRKDMLDVIGDRMILIGRLALAGFKPEDISLIEMCCSLDGEWKGIPDREGPFYDNVRARVAELGVDRIKAAHADTRFGMPQLKVALRAISKAMKSRV